jgi:hypothetical protein
MVSVPVGFFNPGVNLIFAPGLRVYLVVVRRAWARRIRAQ